MQIQILPTLLNENKIDLLSSISKLTLQEQANCPQSGSLELCHQHHLHHQQHQQRPQDCAWHNTSVKGKGQLSYKGQCGKMVDFLHDIQTQHRGEEDLMDCVGVHVDRNFPELPE